MTLSLFYDRSNRKGTIGYDIVYVCTQRHRVHNQSTLVYHRVISRRYLR